MPDYCSVPLCKGFGGFHFPKDPELRKKWQIAIKRQTKKKELWQPSKYSVVCEKHFLETDFDQPKFLYGEKRRKLLKDGVIPSVFPFTKSDAKKTNRSVERSKRQLRRCQSQIPKEPCTSKEIEDISDVGANEEVTDTISDMIEEDNFGADNLTTSDYVSDIPPLEQKHVGTQCDIDASEMFLRSRIQDLKDRPNAIKYYTGFLDYEHFKFFFHCLGPAATNLNYHVNVKYSSETFIKKYLLIVAESLKPIGKVDICIPTSLTLTHL